MPVQQLIIVDQTGQSDSAHVKQMIKFKDALDPNSGYTKKDIRYFKMNPTYILKFVPRFQPSKDLVVFIGKKLRDLGVMSIWRNPLKSSIEPVEIKQLNQHVNLHVKLEFYSKCEAFEGDIVKIERLCTSPSLNDTPKLTKPLDQVPKYGEDKDISTSIKYMSLPKP